MIEYSQQEWVNFYSPEESAIKLTVLFCKDYKQCIEPVESFLKQHRDITPENIKQRKEYCEQVWKEVITEGHTKDSSIEKIIEIEKINPCSLNLIHSLTRIPEWFLYTEEYLSKIYAPRMEEEHLSEINALAIDDSIYPYDKNLELTDDLFTDFDLQENAVLRAIEKEMPDDSVARKRVTKENIKKAMNKISDWVLYRDNDIPEYAQPWVMMMRHIRNNIAELDTQLNQILTIGFTADQLTLSESICYLNDEKWARNFVSNILHWHGKDGKGKISALIGNIFHMYYKGVPIPKTSGQIDAYNKDIDMLYSKAAPGLGPGFKIRIVYSTSSEIQNISEVAASFLRRFHSRCYHYAYLAQTDYIIANVKRFKDVQCTDCTGYSDYLNRNVYRWLLKLMGLSDKNINILMNILGMPVKVNNHIFKVPFGSLQGVKFLVYIMNDANALIGLIQNQLRIIKWTDRQNAGDDVYAASSKECFTKSDLDIDIAVWLWFNCPTNMSKSAWLNRDGYWDFCKVYFGKDGLPLTGLPPKMYNKEILNIRDVSEYFKNFDRTGVVPHRSIEEFVEILKPYLKLKWREGMKLFNPICKSNLEEKLEIAKEISYKIGGLSSKSQTDISRVNHLVQYCYELYTNYDIKVGDIYLWAVQIGFEGTIREFLLTIKSQRSAEFISYLERLQYILNDFQIGYLNTDELDAIESDLESMTRVFLDSGKVSASGSTYHRTTPKRSGDTTLVKAKDYVSEGLEIPYKIPSSVFDFTALAMIASDVSRADITKLNMYAYVTKVYEDLLEDDRLVWSGGGYNHNAGARCYVKDKEGNRYRAYYCLDDCERGDIKPLSSCNDPILKEFISICIQYKIMDGTFSLESLSSRVEMRIARDILTRVTERLDKRIGARFTADNIEKAKRDAFAITEDLIKTRRQQLQGL